MLEPTRYPLLGQHRLPAVGDPPATYHRRRVGERHVVTLPALLTWKDRRGALHLAHAVTRNVSQQGVYVEC